MSDDHQAIEVSRLTKRYGSVVAADQVSLQVPAGCVYGFLGPNGAGKTTTLGMLTGLIPPDSGTATIHGHDVRSDLQAALAEVGAMVEEPAFYGHLSGRQNLRLLASLKGTQGVDHVLAQMGLEAHADRKYRGYSQGMRRRLGLAAALLGTPDVLVLDEPTNGLDPAGQREVASWLQAWAQSGKTVLLSSHSLVAVQEICTHAAVLSRGRIVAAGTMDEVLGDGAAIEVEVDDVARAVAVLAEQGGVEAEVEGRLLVVRGAVDPARLNQVLVGAGVAVRRLAPRGLEERFFALTRSQ